MDTVKLRGMLVLHEGKKSKPYMDTVGKITIGIGRNLTDVGVSEATISQMFNEDLSKTLTFLTTRCPWWLALDDVRQRAIADMTFNLMGKILDFKRMIAALEAKDWTKASNELLNSTFATQTGKRAKTLAHMILTGKDL